MKNNERTGDYSVSKLFNQSNALINKSRRLQNQCADQSDHLKSLEEQSEQAISQSKQLMGSLKKGPRQFADAENSSQAEQSKPTRP